MPLKAIESPLPKSACFSSPIITSHSLQPRINRQLNVTPILDFKKIYLVGYIVIFIVSTSTGSRAVRIPYSDRFLLGGDGGIGRVGVGRIGVLSGEFVGFD